MLRFAQLTSGCGGYKRKVSLITTTRRHSCAMEGATRKRKAGSREWDKAGPEEAPLRPLVFSTSFSYTSREGYRLSNWSIGDGKFITPISLYCREIWSLSQYLVVVLENLISMSKSLVLLHFQLQFFKTLLQTWTIICFDNRSCTTYSQIWCHHINSMFTNSNPHHIRHLHTYSKQDVKGTLMEDKKKTERSQGICPIQLNFEDNVKKSRETGVL